MKILPRSTMANAGITIVVLDSRLHLIFPTPILLWWFADGFDNFWFFEICIYRIDFFQGHVKFPVVSKIIKKGHLCGGLKHSL